MDECPPTRISPAATDPDTIELERWLRHSRAKAPEPAPTPSGFVDRLKSVAALLEQAGPLPNIPTLVFRSPKGEVLGRQVGAKLVVGRKTLAPIEFTDVEISRSHFEIRQEGDLCILHDLNSTNGTWVNGTRIQRRVLRDGDAIRAGSQLFVFVGNG